MSALPEAGRGRLSSTLLRGTAIVVLVQVLTAAVNLAVDVLLARTLGSEGYGTFVYAFRWLVLLTIFGRLGLDSAGLRFLADHRSRQEWSAVRAFVGFSSRVVLLAGTVVAALAVAAIAVAHGWPPGVVGATLILACIVVPVQSLLETWTAALRSLGRVASALLPADTMRPALLGVGLIAVLALDGAVDAPTAMALNIVATIATATLCGLLLRADLGAESQAAEEHDRRRQWMGTALPLAGLALAHMLTNRADVLLLGSLVGSSEVALFAAAKRLSLLITFGVRALDTWIAPRIAELHGRGDREQLQRLLRRGALLTLALTTPLTIAALLWGRSLLTLWGPEFEAAYPALQILAISQVATALFGPVAVLLTMTGLHATALRITIANAVLSLVLGAFLIVSHGFVGAAVATAVIRLSLIGSFTWVAWRRLGLRATVL